MFRRPAALEYLPNYPSLHGHRAAHERHGQREETIRLHDSLPLHHLECIAFAPSDSPQKYPSKRRHDANQHLVTLSHRPPRSRCRVMGEAAGLENLLESRHATDILRDLPTFMQNAREITEPAALATHSRPTSPPSRVMSDDIGRCNHLHQV
jgi:hypothetical protein